MKRLLTSTTALSLVLTPLGVNPAFAQILSENGSVLAVDGTMLCDTSGGAVCDPAEYAEQAAAIEAQMRAADEAAAAEAAAAEQAAAEQAAAEQAAAEQAAAEQAAAEQAAAEQAAAEQAAAEAAAAEQAAAEQAAAEAAAAEQAAAEAAAAEQAAAEQAEAEQAAAEQAAAEQAAAEAAKPQDSVTEEQPAPEPEAVTEDIAQPEAQTETTDSKVEDPQVATEPEVTTESVVEPDPATEPEAETVVEETSDPAAVVTPQTVEPDLPAEIILPEAPVADPTASLKQDEPIDLTEITPVEAIVVEETQTEALSEILVEPTDSSALSPLAAATAIPLVEAPVAGSTEQPIPVVPLSEVPVADDASVMIETLSAADVRTSSQEFAAAPVTLADGRRSGLTAFETVGLVALGALVVGAIINEGRKEERRVVSNTGDRVVVLKPDGTYQVYKDDDTVLRRPGSTVRTETFNDGSTRTIVQRVDGSQIVTIRDASGRVLRRAQYDQFGRERLLIDDFQPEEPVIIRDLPRPKKDRIVISSKDDDAALKARLAALEARKANRGFSLRQIREIPEVRDLAAQIDVERITFDSGSAAIKAEEAENLADLGQLMQELLQANPGEMFLIEGHTDATGHPALNLALSDRRAESVALALAEYFDIPPENLIVQGYGESELLIDTQKDERANRRVLVRVITPLLTRAED